MSLPARIERLRRLRRNAGVRRLFAEVDLPLRRFIQPYFVVPEADALREVAAGNGLWQVGADRIASEVSPLVDAGVGGVLLFGVADEKSEDPDSFVERLAPVQRAIAELRARHPDLVVLADVCLCTYSASGHCGVWRHGRIDNDASLPILAGMAEALASAGAGFVAPSDMMDGRVAAIRTRLDAKGFVDTGIVSYAAKVASAFYDPFRGAARSAPRESNRASYQMPAGNRREALREMAADEVEGADALLVKPALPNLDLLRDARAQSDIPLFAYQVSGEREMLRASAAAGVLDFHRAMEECLLSIRRAGADIIISYETRARALGVRASAP